MTLDERINAIVGAAVREATQQLHARIESLEAGGAAIRPNGVERVRRRAGSMRCAKCEVGRASARSKTGLCRSCASIACRTEAHKTKATKVIAMLRSALGPGEIEDTGANLAALLGVNPDGIGCSLGCAERYGDPSSGVKVRAVNSGRQWRWRVTVEKAGAE